MHDPQQLAPFVLLIEHMRPLTRENPDVIRVTVTFVAVVVMDDLAGPKRPAQLPLCDRPVFVIGFLCPRVPAARVGVMKRLGHVLSLAP